MILYSSFELFSFVLVCLHIQRLFRFSAIRQLAFVLTHQWSHVQAALILWVVYSTQSSLVHYGKSLVFLRIVCCGYFFKEMC